MGNLNELALFAGIGGGILGTGLVGCTPVCAVENDRFCRGILLQRQRDGYLPRFPIWDNVQTFNARPWRGRVDVVSGGFPCQDISPAGQGAGLAGARSSLVFEMLRIVDQVQAPFVFAENSPLLRRRGLDQILHRLDAMGYDAVWCVLGAWHVGAPHKRNRLWILAKQANLEIHPTCGPTEISSDPYDRGERIRAIDDEVAEPPASPEVVADSPGIQLDDPPRQSGREYRGTFGPWRHPPDFKGVDDGSTPIMDRVRTTGNAQVPAVAATAFQILWNLLVEG